MSIAGRATPAGRAPISADGLVSVSPRALCPQPDLTKRRVIDLMRVGRTSCRH